MKHIATVVSGFSGDPDTKNNKTIQVDCNSLGDLPIGTKLYAMQPESSTAKMSIYAHSRDCNTVEIHANGKVYDLTAPRQSNGYVPRGVSIGGGDDLELTIDVVTGHIIGWDAQKVLTKLAEMDEEQEDE